MKKYIFLGLLAIEHGWGAQESSGEIKRKQDLLDNLKAMKKQQEGILKIFVDAQDVFQKNPDAFTKMADENKLMANSSEPSQHIDQAFKKNIESIKKDVETFDLYITLVERSGGLSGTFMSDIIEFHNDKLLNIGKLTNFVDQLQHIADSIQHSNAQKKKLVGWGAVALAIAAAVERWYEGFPLISKQLVLRKLQSIQLKPEDISPAELEFLIIATKASLSATKHQRDSYFKKQVKELDFGDKPISDAVWNATADLYFWRKQKNGVAQIKKMVNQIHNR